MWDWIIPNNPEYLALALTLFKDRVIIPTDINQDIYCVIDETEKQYIRNLFTHRLQMPCYYEKVG